MKFNYYPETDSLYINLSEQPSEDSREISPGVVLDFDKDGHLAGIDVDNASKILELTKIETTSLPLDSFIMKKAS